MQRLKVLLQKTKVKSVRFGLALLAALFLLVQTPVTLAFSGAGAGTEGNPFIITDCTELQEMEDDLDAFYKLGNDIDCSESEDWNSGKGFDPVGDDSTPFIGSLDGDGHTIDGLIINRADDEVDYNEPDDEAYVGLFGYTDASEITNVHITHSMIKGYQEVGGIVGHMEGGTISFSSVNAGIEDNSCNPGYCVWARYGYDGGGLVGRMEGGQISNSRTGGPVKGSGSYIGGITGNVRTSATINDSYSTSNIDGGSYLGGIAGYAQDASISRVFATGNVVANTDEAAGKGGRNVGGFIGNTGSTVSITDSYASGDVTTDNSHAGGFIGQMNDSTTITNSYASGVVTATSDSELVGGFIGYTLDSEDYSATISNSFSTGEVAASDTARGAFIGLHYDYGTEMLSNIYYDSYASNKDACYGKPKIGSGNSEFSLPFGLGLDNSGYILIADYGNNRIQKIDSSGEYISQWGVEGSGNGQLNGPGDVVVNSDGDVYVAEYTNNRIQKFDSDGNYITKWGTAGTGNGQFSSALTLAIDSADNVYVTDRYNNRIQKFDSNGNYITKWGTTGTGNGQLNQPSGIAIDSNDDVYVFDTYNTRIQKFDSDGNYITKWGTAGTGNGQFGYGGEVAVNADDDVYVVDTYNNRIQKFSSTGTYLSQFGISGTEDGELNSPSGIAVASDNSLYVANTGNSHVEKFEADGDLIWSIGGDDFGNVNCTGVNESNTDPDYFFDSTNEPFAGSWDTDVWNFSGTSYPTLKMDFDNDDIDNAVEDAAPNNGDANNDGLSDSFQTNVTSIVNPISGEYASLAMNEECEITSLDIVAEAEVNDTGDADYSYPGGFMDFVADCGTPGFTADIAQYYYGIDEEVVLRKYTPSTGYFTIDDATITSQTIDGNQVTVVTYQVTDGGELDLDGELNGIIEDPVGLGVLGEFESAGEASLADTGESVYIGSMGAISMLIASLYFMRRRKIKGYRS